LSARGFSLLCWTPPLFIPLCTCDQLSVGTFFVWLACSDTRRLHRVQFHRLLINKLWFFTKWLFYSVLYIKDCFSNHQGRFF
jgi:hypothetical protein